MVEVNDKVCCALANLNALDDGLGEERWHERNRVHGGRKSELLALVVATDGDMPVADETPRTRRSDAAALTENEVPVVELSRSNLGNVPTVHPEEFKASVHGRRLATPNFLLYNWRISPVV